jgi:hypothetical protein
MASDREILRDSSAAIVPLPVHILRSFCFFGFWKITKEDKTKQKERGNMSGWEPTKAISLRQVSRKRLAA